MTARTTGFSHDARAGYTFAPGASDAALMAAIGDIRLQFGRDLAGNFVTVPEPAFYTFVSLGGIALLTAFKRRTQKA